MIRERTIEVPVGGRPIDPNSYRQQTGKKKSGGRGKNYNKLKFDEPFIGWDGEGYTDSTGTHHYMMLVASTGDYLLAPEGKSLSTFRCFELFLRVSEQYPRHNHVIFAGGYDFNMILKDLSRQDCERLHRTGRLFFGPYSIEHRHRKSVSIHNRTTGQHVIVYDVWPFFQTSFVKTLKAWGLTDELAEIEAGKDERGKFVYANHREILSYCQSELRQLVALMDQFRDGLRTTDLYLNRWDGPGAVAGTLYRKHKMKEHKRAMVDKLEQVNKAAQRAYFGGRIEPVQFGNHEGETYYYDINSAYPAAISELPSLAHGRWVQTRDDSPPVTPGSLYHLEWDFLTWPVVSFYPLPFRRPDGTISFFPKGRGWFHSPEYELVRDLPGVKVREAFIFHPATDDKPFQWVREMYDLRREWKQAGRGEEKILKLGLNSLYGKMVQQLGYSKERGLPPYHQLEWGGYVTSWCRAMLYRAASTDSDAIIGFETDGILSTCPLRVDLGDGLGEWGVERYDGVTYCQPGVYWLLRDGEWTPKHRGFDPGTLTRSAVLEAWQGDERSDPYVCAKSTRFVGMGLALQEDFRLWRRWETRDRYLRVWPDNPKREHTPGRTGCQGVCIPLRGPGSRTFPPDPSHQLHRTRIMWDNPGYWKDEESEPYPLKWRDTGRYTYADLVRDRDETYYWEETARL